jgi:hypothetical protein
LWPGVADDEGCFVAEHLYALFRRLICAVPKWTTFRHNGVHLEAPYTEQPLGANLLYASQPVELTLEQEEMVLCYMEHLKKADSDGIHRPDDVFRCNLMKSWRPILDKTSAGQRVVDLALCDFSALSGPLDAVLKQRTMAMFADVIARNSPETACLIADLGAELPFAGRRSIFAGTVKENANGTTLFDPAEEHPLRGTFRPRMPSEAFTLNLDRLADAPPVPAHGDGKVHVWGGVISNPTVLWLAKYRDVVTGDFQYIFPVIHTGCFFNRPDDDPPWGKPTPTIVSGFCPTAPPIDAAMHASFNRRYQDFPRYHWGTGATAPTPTCQGDCSWGDGRGNTWNTSEIDPSPGLFRRDHNTFIYGCGIASYQHMYPAHGPGSDEEEETAEGLEEKLLGFTLPCVSLEGT